MELAIDSVGPIASVALSDAGRPVAEITWPTGRRHTPTLVPAVDELCRLAAVARSDITALFVDVGPGAYGGIRAGMATAMGLALALGTPAVGVGRLEIEAYAHATAGRVAALHAGGRGQWAFALYQGPADAWRELQAPRLLERSALLQCLAQAAAGDPPGVVVCGDVDVLAAADDTPLREADVTIGGSAAGVRRAGLLAELGWRRLQRGGDFAPGRLEPIYLREPAIGPQPPAEADPEPEPKEEEGA